MDRYFYYPIKISGPHCGAGRMCKIYSNLSHLPSLQNMFQVGKKLPKGPMKPYMFQIHYNPFKAYLTVDISHVFKWKVHAEKNWDDPLPN